VSADRYTEITRRLVRLEKQMLTSSSLIARMARWFGTRKRNAVSRSLSGPEIMAFKARMAAHGVEDDESRDESPEKVKVRR
jgi:hypothetical protein